MSAWIFSFALLAAAPLLALTAQSQEISSTEQAAPIKQPTLLLYYSPYCPYSMKVVDYLKKIHKTVPMKNVQNDAAAKKELREQGGKAVVPCLMIDGKPLYESEAIIQWLSKHQDALQPAV